LQDGELIPKEGQAVLLIIDAGEVALIVLRNGTPVLVRSLGTHGDLSDAENISAMAGELGYTLASLETEWGSAASTAIHLWTRNDVKDKQLRETLHDETGLNVVVQNLDELPPACEGIAKRAQSNSGSLNLVPEEWITTEEHRRLRNKLLALMAAFLGLWVVGVAAFYVGLGLQKQQLASLVAISEGTDATTVRVRQLRDKVMSLQQYADRSHSALESLRMVTETMPVDLDLTSFTYKKGRAVILRGEAEKVEPIYNYIENLEKCGFFEDVKSEGISTRNSRGTQKVEFQRITARFPGEKS